MLAKRFSFVCAGLLCLTAAYQLGARNAHGQSGNEIASADRADGQNCFGLMAVDALNRVYSNCGGSWQQKATLPGPVAALFQGYGRDAYAVLKTGDIYYAEIHSGPWSFQHQGSVFSAPTPSLQSTFGNVKDRYRGERTASLGR